MITIERTGGGLCGETHVKHDGKTLVFHRDADVSATDFGVCIIERGLAISRATYLLDGPRYSNGVLAAKADAVRIHIQQGTSISVVDFQTRPNESYTVTKHGASIEIALVGPSGQKPLKYFPFEEIKAVVAEQSLITVPPPPVALPASAPLITQVFVALWPFKSATTP